MTRISIGLAALISTALAAPALAEQKSFPVGPASYHIWLDDLDLASATGRRAALARVERAATRLCANERIAADRRACVEATVGQAAKLRRPLALALRERDGIALAVQ